ncbi:hypothetical protein F5Y11DRAFT_343228 [Daldinia sp. FL1419]|nr:hypothetical protein F5Y11DRAFT_343228 [Daldinia sp. FL1419]
MGEHTNPSGFKDNKQNNPPTYSSTTNFVKKPSNTSNAKTNTGAKSQARQPSPSPSNHQGDSQGNTQGNTQQGNTQQGNKQGSQGNHQGTGYSSNQGGNNQGNNNDHSAYQTAGPGFNHTVANLPGIGLVIDGVRTNPTSNPVYSSNSVFGPNPASGAQPEVHHQTPGHNPPQFLPPGFPQLPTQVPVQPFPQFTTVGGNQTPVMASFMPNQGQHFQPPVPDTTYGPIPHTYHPRFDSKPSPAPGQYVMIEGQVYLVAACPSGVPGPPGPPGPPGSAQVQYVPVQQQPGTGAPIVIQQGSQQPIFVQGQPSLSTAPIIAQPAAFPAMVGQSGAPMVIGGTQDFMAPGSAPDVMGIGKTANEIQLEQYHTALNTGALEGQDIAPSDPDPSRMYYCRELDGVWTLRNRYCIDNMGDCRWFVKPGGIFYAVRLAD